MYWQKLDEINKITADILSCIALMLGLNLMANLQHNDTF